MKNCNGKVLNIDKLVVGIYTTKNNIFKKNRIVKCSKVPLFTFGAKALIVPLGVKTKRNVPVLQTNENIEFEENDIVTINHEGKCNAVWEPQSGHNAFYVTDKCNSKCIMCPQVVEGGSRYKECFEILKFVDLKHADNIGITGGEPTLEIDNLVKLLKQIAKKVPNKNVHILTNGRIFSKIENVKKLAKIKKINLSFGIPLYSDIAEEHDYIVGASGAFQQTVRGFYNLAKYRQNIEIRIVIMRQNYKILDRLAKYIYRNLPFVSHIALMGMEYHGNAQTNYEKVAIDPIEYKDELYNAVKNFIRYDIVTDVYNIPLCLADSRIHEFCRDSISTWKKTYLEICEQCSHKESCSGVFETSFTHSKNIKPF